MSNEQTKEWLTRYESGETWGSLLDEYEAENARLLQQVKDSNNDYDDLHKETASLRQQLEAAWDELAEIDGHESLAKAISNAIQRRNKEALRLESQLEAAEAARDEALGRLAAAEGKAALATEMRPHLRHTTACGLRYLFSRHIDPYHCTCEVAGIVARYDALE